MGALQKGLLWGLWALALLAWLLAIVGVSGMQRNCREAQGVTPASRFRAADCSRVLSLPWCVLGVRV
jgi:hypothetical protein